MAIIQKKPCAGIFVEVAGEGQVYWRTLTETVAQTREAYLVDAAAKAAEELVFGKAFSEPLSDKRDFSLPGAPSWEATVADARSIMTPHLDAIRRIAAAVQRVRDSTPVASLPEETIEGKKLRRVLSTEEINRAFYGCDCGSAESADFSE